MESMRLSTTLFYLLLISISLGTRVLLYQFTPEFREYETAFVYLGDIFLVLFLVSLRRGNFKKWFSNLYNKFFGRSLILFLGLADLSIFLAASFGLAFYSWIRLVLLAL